MKSRFAVLVLAAVLVVLALVPASSSAGRHPWLGVYDCQGLGSPGPLHSIKLAGHGKYLWSQYRKKKHLQDPVRGKWKMRGKKVKFRSGVYKRSGISGLWYPPGPTNSHSRGYIALKNKQGGSTNITCYPIP